MSFEDLLPYLEEEVLDPEEETFLLFARPIPSHNLGFIDPKAQTLDITVASKDYTIHQSPGVLSSNRAGGTTGAVLWKITPLFADFLSNPKNPFFTTSLLSPSSAILELGCGISPLTALALSPTVKHYTLTDQSYVQKLINLNITENKNPKNISFRTLDWEEDEVTKDLSPTGVFDAVVAVDCVYNEALVRPLVQTLRDVCLLKRKEEGDGERECVAVVAQQLRSDDVFQAWLTEFHKEFRTWRLDDEAIPEGLRPDDGFVVHVGTVRGEGRPA